MPKEFVSGTQFYDYKTPVTQALEKLKKYGAVVVFRNREYYGVVDDRSIFRNRSLTSFDFSKKFSVGKLARKVPTLDSGTSLGRMINYFHECSAKALPYKEGNKITGVVRREVVVSTVISLHLISKLKVSDIMSSPILVTDSDSNIAQAASTMTKNGVTRLVVVDNGKLSGLLTMHDISVSFTKPQERLPERKSYSFSPAKVSVASMMRTPVHTIDVGRPAEEAARKLLEMGVSSLVVTKGSKPIGVVTVRDVLERAAATTAKTQRAVLISGLDEYTRDHEESIRDGVNRLVEKIDKFEKLEVDYVSVNVKRHKERNYEVSVRLELKQKGALFSRANGYNLDSTLASLLDSIYERVKEGKENLVSNKRLEKRYYGE
jgi:predicted transcriptional regulator